MRSNVSKVTFPGSTGEELAGRLDLPPAEPRAIVLFAHCFTCGKDIAAASRIATGLVAEGFGVLRFDFTGLGSSEGEFANTNFSSNVEDLVAAADWLRAEHEAPSLLVGHSLGGAAVLAAAARIPEVEAVATLGAPSDVDHVTGLIDDASRARIETEGEAEVSLAGRPFTIRKQFLDDASGAALLDAVGSMKKALLVMHSPIDELVSVDHAAAIYQAAKHPKSFIGLDGADHLLTDRTDAAFVASMLATWADRYLPRPEQHDHGAHEGDVFVTEAGTGTFTQLLHAGNHTILADEPRGIGDDTGLNPYELLLGGLGACTSMTLRMYADRKKIPLDHVRVTLRHERTRADDCADPEDPCRIERIEREVEVFGDDLTDDHRADLLRIADKCPVHRTLESDLRIETEIRSG